MNGTIKSFVEQVGFSGYSCETGDYIIPVPAFENRIERLVQSIVEECAKIIDDIPSSPQGSWSDGYYEGCRDSAKTIRKHFGVK